MAPTHPAVVNAAVLIWWVGAWAIPVLGPRFGLGPAYPSELVAVFTTPVPIVAWSLVTGLHGDLDGFPTALAAGFALVHGATWWTRRESGSSVIDLIMSLGFFGVAVLVWLGADVAVPLFCRWQWP